MTQIALIAAYDLSHAIGKAGKLPWHLPSDLKRFKRLTVGQSVLMGRKTFDSIGKPLVDRQNLVLSRDSHWKNPGATRVAELSEALALAQSPTLWVIGGAEIYQLTIAIAQRMELTEVALDTPDADAWFPEWTPEHWTQVACEAHVPDQKNPHAWRNLSLMRRA